MNLETLKTNRELIISEITKKYSESLLKEVMSYLVSHAEDTCTDNINDFLEEMFDMFDFKMRSKKDTGNRLILGKLAELEF
jgi:hypothetical protein